MAWVVVMPSRKNTQRNFSFFLNICQRSTEYLSRVQGKKYSTREASAGDSCLVSETSLYKCGVQSYLCAGNSKNNLPVPISNEAIEGAPQAVAGGRREKITCRLAKCRTIQNYKIENLEITGKEEPKFFFILNKGAAQGGKVTHAVLNGHVVSELAGWDAFHGLEQVEAKFSSQEMQEQMKALGVELEIVFGV